MYLFAYVHVTQQISGSSPYVIALLARIFHPFQGLFNIIIYTRVRESKLRAETGYCWIRAFYLVVTSFDDHDDLAGRGNRQSRRKTCFIDRVF